MIKVRTWDQVLAFGLGFGGMEAIYLGAVVIALAAAVATGQPLPPAQPISGILNATLVDTSLTGIIVGAIFVIERIMAICLHIFFAVLNAQALRTRRVIYLLYAISLHTAVDFLVGLVQAQFHMAGVQLLWLQVPLWAATYLFFYRYIRRAIQQPWSPAVVSGR